MRPYIALVVAAVIWGAAPPIFKFAYENIPPFTLGFLRFTLSLFIMVPFLRGTNMSKIRGRDWIILTAASLFMAAHLSLFFIGLERTESINTSIIASVGPIMLYIASVTFLHETKSNKILTGMIIALLGSLIVIVAPLVRVGGSVGFGEFSGNMLILLSTIGEIISITLLKKVLTRITPKLALIVSFAITALIFYPLTLWELQTWSFAQLDYRGIWGVVFGTLFSSTIAYYLHDYGISKIKAEEVGLFSYITPIVTVLVAIPLLAEFPDPYFYAGTALVFWGIVIAENKFRFHPAYELKRQKPH